MCVPACERKLARAISRRQFFKRAGAVAAAAAGSSFLVKAQSDMMSISASQVVDLTHTLTPDFPTFGGEAQFENEAVFKIDSDGYNLNVWHINEHTGTHMDAPFHFSNGDSADMIPATNLVGPLAIVDIRAKAANNPDAEVTPDDIMAWESQHGDLPAGAVVAMNSGWDAHVQSDMFRNLDDDGVMHFPGFHIEASQYLLEKDVKGIMVDTLSLDFGKSADFAVHFNWLPANRWGIENVANLSSLPLSGATVVVGGPKLAGATGGPSRVMALV